MMRPEDISVVTVAYKSAETLPGMLESLPQGQDVVIVDNGPDDGMRMLARDWGAKVLVPGENLGFGPACNLGAAEAAGSHLLFLNPDARLRPGTLAALAEAVTRHPGAGGFGPVQVDAAGKRFFKRRTRVAPGLPSLPKAVPDEDTRVPVLSGAVLLVPVAAFRRVGGFDPRIFLFYEDDDLSLRLARQAGPLWLIPSAEVLHIGGTSTAASTELARFKGFHWGRSRVYVSRKHGTPRALLRGLVNGLNLLLSVRSIGSPLRRAEALGRIAGAWSMRGTTVPPGRGASA